MYVCISLSLYIYIHTHTLTYTKPDVRHVEAARGDVRRDEDVEGAVSERLLISNPYVILSHVITYVISY